ncbi:MAG: radical SAM family heme chaperone HemW [Desulfamplus sp.]|nr:radical SAM family heme chaperone HemW [Desulfamplus sp.]
MLLKNNNNDERCAIAVHSPPPPPPPTAAGIYIHIPFCIRKCPYCDFYSISDLSFKKRFVTDLIKELEMRADPALIVDTIYFGGGTPSLLTSGELEKIVAAVTKSFKFPNKRQDLQITMEVNPGSVKESYFKEIREYGVNRLSVGVQSFQNRKLAFLERIHSADASRQTILSARDAGFDDIGIDLMYGLPEETEKIWLADLEAALECHPEHISCYMLSYESDTPMFAAYKRGDIKPLDDGKAASLFKLTSEYLVSKGFSHYEISNFAATLEHQSIHNKKYWEMVTYLGFGPSAHSYYFQLLSDNALFKRSWNTKSVHKYLSLIENGILPVAEQETLTNEQQLIEMIMVGLRTDKGVDIKSFEQLYGECQFEIIFKDVINQLEKRSWGKIEGERCRLTNDGWLFLDTILRWFVNKMLK